MGCIDAASVVKYICIYSFIYTSIYIFICYMLCSDYRLVCMLLRYRFDFSGRMFLIYLFNWKNVFFKSHVMSFFFFFFLLQRNILSLFIVLLFAKVSCCVCNHIEALAMMQSFTKKSSLTQKYIYSLLRCIFLVSAATKHDNLEDLIKKRYIENVGKKKF